MMKQLRYLKSLALAVGLLTAAHTMAGNELGKPVTEFTEPSKMMLDHPYTLLGPTRTLLRYEVLTFKISAPADGQYAVEYLVNATGNNIQLATTASKTITDGYEEPDYSSFAHMTTVTDEDLPEIVGEEADPFVPAEPVYLYSSVNLKEGMNYVHVWMHVYWRNDALAPQKVQFKSIRILPEGSGMVGDVAARASQKAFRVKYFRSLQDATTATMVSNYEALVKAINEDYTKADVTAVLADIAAAEAKEQEVRHGKGVIVEKDSTRIDLLLYHNEYNNKETMEPLGGYDESGAYEMEIGMEDYPAQLEFTRNNYFTYKFTAGFTGNFFIQYLASSQNSATIDMTVLADDSTTVVMPTYKLSTGNGAWQNYELMDKRDVAKFAMEEGKTYFLHMYYNQYTNVRDILIRHLPKVYHTVEQLDSLISVAENVLAYYDEGSDGYYAVEDKSLLIHLGEVVDEAYEVAFVSNPDPTQVDEMFEKLQDALLALDNIKSLNIIPSKSVGAFDVTAFSESNNCSYKMDGDIMQLDNFRSGGYMIYKLYNKKDAKYQVDFEFAHANDGAKMQFQFYVVENDVEFICADATSEEFAGTGGWQVFEPKQMEIGGVPAGYVYLKITGTGPSYVGNPRLFTFTPIEGTEGAGAQALADAKEAYYAQFTVESVNSLIEEAKTLIAPYALGTEYDNLIEDRTPIENIEAAIADAEAAIAADDVEARTAAYLALQKAMQGISKLKILNTLPTSFNYPFDLASYDTASGVVTKMSEGLLQLDSFKDGGSIVYKVWNTQDAEYEVEFNFAHANDGASLEFVTYVMEDTVELVCSTNKTEEFESTGGWQSFLQKSNIKVGAIPQGHAYIRINGFGPSYVGNMRSFAFTPIAGTEGAGAKALADAKEEWANGINEIVVSNRNNRGIYNMSGQYLGTDNSKLSKGIYIINGKKVVVK